MNIIATMCFLSVMTAGTDSQQPSSTDVPEWVGADLPFDAAHYFSLPDENAAPFYNPAFEEFSEEMYWQNHETQRAKSIHDRQAQFDKIYDSFNSHTDSVDSSEIDRVLNLYEKGFRLLGVAQQQSDCVFSIKVEGLDSMVLRPYPQAAREAGRVLDLKIHHDVRSGMISEAIQMLEIQLRLSRDLRPRGKAVDQLVACTLEWLAFEKSVPRILAAPTLDPEECRNLLELLVQHQQATDVDPVLQSEQYDHLRWRKLFYQLAGDDFDPAAVAEEWDLQVTNPMAGTVLIPLFDHIFNCDLNSDELRNIARRLAKDNSQLAKLHKRVNELPEADELLGAKLDETIAALVIQNRIGLNPNVDFGNDRKTLNRRYAQIARVRRFSEPRRVKQLVAFEQQWASDSDVRDTTLLQLFEPAPIAAIGRAEQRNTLLLHVAQCLTAVKRWQLEQGELPPDLKSATSNAEFKSVPLDPTNGKPIQLSLNDEPAIYASGADQRWPIPQKHKANNRECPRH